MATAIYSALTLKPARHDIAMTGEITLRGNVLPIGGLKEKSMAAFKNGITTVIIPRITNLILKMSIRRFLKRLSLFLLEIFRR